jgi:hypothetical protein
MAERCRDIRYGDIRDKDLSSMSEYEFECSAYILLNARILEE